MATLSVTVPDAIQVRILAAIRGLYPGQVNGMTDAQAGQWIMKATFKDLVTRWEAQKAYDTAASTVQTDFSGV